MQQKATLNILAITTNLLITIALNNSSQLIENLLVKTQDQTKDHQMSQFKFKEVRFIHQ